MKNIFYFILTVLIISCNNNKNNNKTNESIILIDSLQKVNDLILAENQNLKLSLFEAQRNLDNLKSNQVLDKIKPNAMSRISIVKVRGGIPIFGQEVNGHPLTRLDNVAESKNPNQVFCEVNPFYQKANSNILI